MSEPSTPPPPPRAFTQGLGLIFQFVGVVLFMTMMFICCASSLFNKDWATHTSLNQLDFHGYTAQRALSSSLFTAVFFGIALAGIGLGLQAENRAAPRFAVALTSIATLFWLAHLLFAAAVAHSIVFSLVAAALLIPFLLLLILSIAAAREMKKNPPPRGHEVLPVGYKIPYSHLHEDPPEVRLAAELEQRRRRLEIAQKELELLEEKLKKQAKDLPPRNTDEHR